jgi:hypothetical protein
MTDRTAAALASALPAGIKHDFKIMGGSWDTQQIAAFQAERLAESGYQLVYRPTSAELIHQTFAEHTAEALALIHDHVEASDE